MAYIILPHRWQSQPQYPVEIDRSNAIGNKVVYASTVSGAVHNNVGHTLPTAFSASRPNTNLASPYGMGTDFVAASSQYVQLATADFSAVRGYPLTVSFRAKIDVAAGVCYSFNSSTWNAIFGILNTTHYLVNVGSSTSSLTVDGASTGWKHFSVVHRSSAWLLYIDGVPYTPTVADNAWGQPAAGNYSIGNRLNGASPQYFDGVIQDLCVINGEITANEALSLYRNPYQIFKPQQRRIWVPVSAGGAYSVALTAAALGLSSNAIGVNARKQATLTTASLNFAANAVAVLLGKTVALTAASLNFTANAIGTAFDKGVALTTASLNFTANAITFVSGQLYSLTAASLNFTANAVGTAFDKVVALTTASLNFSANAITVTVSGVVAVLGGLVAFLRRRRRL